MRRLQFLPTLVRIVLATIALMLSAGAFAHQGEHGGAAQKPHFVARAIEPQALQANDAGPASLALHAPMQEYAATAPPCPGGAGGSCCCSGFAGVASTPAQLIVPLQARFAAPQRAPQRFKPASGKTLPMALLVAATHCARAPPRLS